MEIIDTDVEHESAWRVFFRNIYTNAKQRFMSAEKKAEEAAEEAAADAEEKVAELTVEGAEKATELLLDAEQKIMEAEAKACDCKPDGEKESK